MNSNTQQAVTNLASMMLLGRMMSVMMTRMFSAMTFAQKNEVWPEGVISEYERKYGVWATRLAVKRCPIGNVACVEREALKLAHKSGVYPSRKVVAAQEQSLHYLYAYDDDGDVVAEDTFSSKPSDTEVKRFWADASRKRPVAKIRMVKVTEEIVRDYTRTSFRHWKL